MLNVSEFTLPANLFLFLNTAYTKLGFSIE
jgi:hypothetical protein